MKDKPLLGAEAVDQGMRSVAEMGAEAVGPNKGLVAERTPVVGSTQGNC